MVLANRHHFRIDPGAGLRLVDQPGDLQKRPPAALGEVDKDFYRVTIAQVFWVTGDLERASLRLVLLEDPDPVDALGAQAQRALATGNDPDARALALLASVLQNTSPIQAPTLESTSVPATATELPQPLIPTYTLPIPTGTP